MDRLVFFLSHLSLLLLLLFVLFCIVLHWEDVHIPPHAILEGPEKLSRGTPPFSLPYARTSWTWTCSHIWLTLARPRYSSSLWRALSVNACVYCLTKARKQKYKRENKANNKTQHKRKLKGEKTYRICCTAPQTLGTNNNRVIVSTAGQKFQCIKEGEGELEAMDYDGCVSVVTHCCVLMCCIFVKVQLHWKLYCVR